MLPIHSPIIFVSFPVNVFFLERGLVVGLSADERLKNDEKEAERMLQVEIKNAKKIGMFGFEHLLIYTTPYFLIAKADLLPCDRS